MLQQLRQVYTKSCNYKIANNLDYVQTSRCVHIHYVQTRHCVHIVYVQTSHSVHIHYVQTRPTFLIWQTTHVEEVWMGRWNVFTNHQCANCQLAPEPFQRQKLKSASLSLRN